MILIEVISAIAIACIGIAFLFKLPFFAFITTVPVWMFVAVSLGTGAMYGATTTNPEPVERRRRETFADAVIRAIINAIAIGMLVIFVGGLALIFGLSLSLFWQDPILVRVISSLLSLCVGYIAGIAIAGEIKKRSPDRE